MPTFSDLIDATIGTLYGHSTDQPALGTLVGDITATSTELAIDFGDQPGSARPNGLIEVGRELIHVTRYDPTTGIATCAPWGRGQRGTSAVTHDRGDMVTVRPRYPRATVGRVLNEVVQSMCPPLFAARDLDPIVIDSYTSWGYELPDDTLRVLRVDSTEPGPEELSARLIVRDWTVRTVAGTQLLELPNSHAYRTVQVTVAATPGRLVYEGDDYATKTGLAEATADMAQLGAIARLVLGGELARTQMTSVEATARNTVVSSGSTQQLARFYQALYTQRLEAERDRLQSLYPLQMLKRR